MFGLGLSFHHQKGCKRTYSNWNANHRHQIPMSKYWSSGAATIKSDVIANRGLPSTDRISQRTVSSNSSRHKLTMVFRFIELRRRNKWHQLIHQARRHQPIHQERGNMWSTNPQASIRFKVFAHQPSFQAVKSGPMPLHYAIQRMRG